MGCRDKEKCEAAAKEIRGKTLNPHVYACQLDLASMKSIREFAERVKQGVETKTYNVVNNRNNTESVTVCRIRPLLSCR